MHLVDTNVVSELVRPRPDANVIAWFAEQQRFALSVVTIEELAFGLARAKSARRTKLASWFEDLVATSQLIDVTPAVARAAGELRADRETAGRPVAQADMLIAASALVHGLTVVTRNVIDFEGCGVALVNPFTA